MALNCKRLPRNIPTHDAPNNMQRTQLSCKKATHKLTKLSNAHNSYYCSWSLTLPNYIQQDSKIITLTSLKNVYSLLRVKSHFINQRTPGQYCSKIIKYYKKQVICVWQKFVETICQSFMLLKKFGTKLKCLCEEIMQLTFKALAFHQHKS